MADINRSSEHPEHQSKTILIVDDDDGIAEFLVTVLVMEDYRALRARDGLQAQEMVKTLVPDLFLLDYQLPGINGLDLADHLHAIEALKQIPVLLMSANLPKHKREKRSIAFIQKPFEVETLLQTIKQLLDE